MSAPETSESPRTIVTERCSPSDRERPGSGKSSADDFIYAPRYSRRLDDKILIAFHQACDQGDHRVADELLQVLTSMFSRQSQSTETSRRHAAMSLIAAHERLLVLRGRSVSDRPSDVSGPSRLVEFCLAKEEPAPIIESNCSTLGCGSSLVSDGRSDTL